MVKRHPTHGWEICRHLKSVADALPCIRHHHEKLDGSGYPDKLSGDQISRPVRIMSIADVYDALASARSYKPAFAPETCFRILRDEAARSWWDKDLVEAFIDRMKGEKLDQPDAAAKIQEAAKAEARRAAAQAANTKE
jgi:HD-GYP domain-containing protein (c-di-GMP phosphodiesterase class II)